MVDGAIYWDVQMFTTLLHMQKTWLHNYIALSDCKIFEIVLPEKKKENHQTIYKLEYNY